MRPTFLPPPPATAPTSSPPPLLLPLMTVGIVCVCGEKSKTCGENYKVEQKIWRKKKKKKKLDRKEKKTRYAHLIEPARRGRVGVGV